MEYEPDEKQDGRDDSSKPDMNHMDGATSPDPDETDREQEHRGQVQSGMGMDGSTGPVGIPESGGESRAADDDERGLFDTSLPVEPPVASSSDGLPLWAAEELRMLRKELFALLCQIEAIVGEMPDDDSSSYR